MPFKIIRNDITKVEADVIVNTANPEPVVGDGTDSAVYQAAGKENLLEERIKIGKLSPGQAAITPAFDISAKYIIHTVGPIWKDGKQGEDDILRSCYSNSLLLAEQVNAESIAFPLIATGVYGFPKNEALDIALSEIGKFLLTHDMEIILVVFDKESFQISEQLMGEIDQYIDEFGIKELYTDEYTERTDMYRRRRLQEQADYEIDEEISSAYAPIIAENDDSSLEDILDNTGETFQQCLLRLIRESGVDEVEIYKKANIDRKLF
ncbi:macro domain-containing protein, partial [Ruminococcus flavefaciens]|uniref:macro domain-containing protein n=1 Tax=Ruminococcus flavefaciens TaxID=1265 RepID=UPI00055B427E